MARIREALRRILFLPPALPSQIQIEVTNRCNLSCLMCPREALGVSKEDMPFELLQQVVDRIEGVKLVTLTGWGEPFIHPDLFTMIHYCKGKGLKVKLSTNGTLVDEVMQRRIVDSGLDSITFSLESIGEKSEEGHRGEKVVENLKRLLDLRKAKIPEVVIQVTIHQGKEEDLYELIRLGAEIGADRINLSRLDLRFNPSLKRPSHAEEEALFRGTEHLGAEKGIQVDFIPYAISHGMERLSYRILRKSLHRFGKYCLRLYDYLYINLKGEATPCCSLPLYSVGDILKEDLRAIWKGEQLREFRKEYKRICGACDQWRIHYKKIPNRSIQFDKEAKRSE
ncbi:MAG: radical SAM protein [Proteobacteria bacterium]|nr:radical SAM protein [Pseudomonadota bacterium]